MGKKSNYLEGDDKVKQAKVQTYWGCFEKLKMKEEENVASYLLRVDEVVNNIRGLGEEVDDIVIVQKVLRSLPLIFYANLFTL